MYQIFLKSVISRVLQCNNQLFSITEIYQFVFKSRLKIEILLWHTTEVTILIFVNKIKSGGSLCL